MKKSRWFALLLALCLVLGGVLVVSAFPHTVRYGDTLYSLARHYNTTVHDIVKVNNLSDPDKIYVDQILEIPGTTHSPAAVGQTAVGGQAPPPVSSSLTYRVQPGDTLYMIAQRFNSTVIAIAQINDLRDVSYLQVGQVLIIPGDPTHEPSVVVPLSPDTAAIGVKQGGACVRLNFLKGRDWYSGARSDGVFVVKEFDGRGAIASWHANMGDIDSGWIRGIQISFPTIHVLVEFYPADGSAPTLMEIVNASPNSPFGWIADNVCHSIEIQYPAD